MRVCRHLGFTAALLTVAAVLPSCAKQAANEAPARASRATVTRADGGWIGTNLGYGIVLNQKSTLRREWITFHDPDMPADLQGTVGVTTVYVSKDYSGEYRYRANLTLTPQDSLSAVEVTLLTFDVWGHHARTLTSETIEDLPPGKPYSEQPEWTIYGGNEASDHYASIAYISRLRTKTGRVVEMNTDPVLVEARKFSAKFSPEDLEPNPEKKPGKS